MSSNGTVAQLKTIASRLRGYITPDGATLASLSGCKVYERSAPPDAIMPYVVVRKINAFTERGFGNTREQFDLEITCYVRGRQHEQEASAICDLVMQALLSWREASASAGLTLSQSARRDQLDFTQSPADTEVRAERIVIECVSWPAYLTALTT